MYIPGSRQKADAKRSLLLRMRALDLDRPGSEVATEGKGGERVGVAAAH